MAKKNDFSGMQTSRVYAAIEQAASQSNQQGKASPQEQAERAAAMKTQGRKGCKAGRINMAFTPDNIEFIRVMSKASGKNMTEFVNLVITAYRNEHPEILGQARAFLDTINSGMFSQLLEADKEE